MNERERGSGGSRVARASSRSVADHPEVLALRLHRRWIDDRGGFGRSLFAASEACMLGPVLAGLVAALAAPATAALLQVLVRHPGSADDLAGEVTGHGPVSGVAGPPGGWSAGGWPVVAGLVVAVAVGRVAAWSSTVLLRRRCELVTVAVSRCLMRRAVHGAGLDAAFSTNLIVTRWPEVLAQYVFLAELPGNVVAVVALLAVATWLAGPAAALAAAGGIAVVLGLGWAASALEARRAFAVERSEAGRTRLMATLHTARATLARQGLGPQAAAAFDAVRRPQARALRRHGVAAATAQALWAGAELLALLAAIAALAVTGRLETLGPALGLLVIVRLLGEQITGAAAVVSCLLDARPVLHTLHTRWLHTPDPTTRPNTGPGPRSTSPTALTIHPPNGARVAVIGPDGAGARLLNHHLTAARTTTATTTATGGGVGPDGSPGGAVLLERSRPLLPGTVRTNITFEPAADHTAAPASTGEGTTLGGVDDVAPVDERRYAWALRVSGLDRDLCRWNPPGPDRRPDRRRTGGDDGLSDGERARTQLANALYWQPTTLLLDDVFAAFDPDTAHHVAARLLAPRPAPRPARLGSPPGPGGTEGFTGSVWFTSTRPELAVWADHVALARRDSWQVLPAGEVTPDDLALIDDPTDRTRWHTALHTTPPTAPAANPSPDHAPDDDALPGPGTGPDHDTERAEDRGADPTSDSVHPGPMRGRLLRHAVGLYGRGATALGALGVLVAVLAAIAAAQAADRPLTGPTLGPTVTALAVLTTAAAVLTFAAYTLTSTRAVARLTRLQHHVLTRLTTPGDHHQPTGPSPGPPPGRHDGRAAAGAAPAGERIALSRLTGDVHLAEFRGSPQLVTNTLGVTGAAVFFVLAATDTPVLLAGLLPALALITWILIRARPRREHAQRLAVTAREPLLLYAETALRITPTITSPAALTAIEESFTVLSDAVFTAGRRSLNLRARLLATVEALALGLFTLTTLTITLATGTSGIGGIGGGADGDLGRPATGGIGVGIGAAALIYLAYSVTTRLAGIVEQVAQADSLTATLDRVASLTGHTTLAIPPPRARTEPRTATAEPRRPDRRPAAVEPATAPPVRLTPGHPSALTGASGTGKSLLLRRIATIALAYVPDAAAPGTTPRSEARATHPPRRAEPRVVLLEADLPPLGLNVRDVLDPHGVHDPTAVAASWALTHRTGPVPSLDQPVDDLPHAVRQRVNLARAHLLRARVLLLDEALSALDPADEHHAIGLLTHGFPTTAVLVALHRRDNLDLFDHHIELPTPTLAVNGAVPGAEPVAVPASHHRPDQRDEREPESRRGQREQR